jgi:hypothetical protein
MSYTNRITTNDTHKCTPKIKGRISGTCGIVYSHPLGGMKMRWQWKKILKSIDDSEGRQRGNKNNLFYYCHNVWKSNVPLEHRVSNTAHVGANFGLLTDERKGVRWMMCETKTKSPEESKYKWTLKTAGMQTKEGIKNRYNDGNKIQ